MKSTVGQRGRVPIPKPVRQQSGIKPGTKLDFYVENGRLIVIKADEKRPVEKVYGYLGKTIDTDAFIMEIRNLL